MKNENKKIDEALLVKVDVIIKENIRIKNFEIHIEEIEHRNTNPSSEAEFYQIITDKREMYFIIKKVCTENKDEKDKFILLDKIQKDLQEKGFGDIESVTTAVKALKIVNEETAIDEKDYIRASLVNPNKPRQ